MERVVLLIVIFCMVCPAVIQAPFDVGFSMSSLGAIRVGDDNTGREPWSSAVFYDDTTKWSGAFFTTAFHSTLAENYKLLEVGVGGQFSHKDIITIKLGVSRFTAFKVYYEQQEKLSFATRLLPVITPGVDLCLTRVGVYLKETEPHRLLTSGFHIKADAKSFCAVLSLKNITIFDNGIDGLAPDRTMEVGFFSKVNRLGAQGVKVSAVLDNSLGKTKISLTLGEQLRLFKYFYVALAFRTYPLAFSFGLTLPLKRVTSEVGFVQMGWLGWSQGISGEWR